MTVTARVPIAHSEADAVGLEPALERLIARAARGRSRATVSAATVKIPPLEPIGVFGAALRAGADASLWLQPEAGLALVAIDEAWAVEANGNGRFRHVAAAWRGLLTGALLDGPADVPMVGPLLLGGFGFWPEPARTATWAGFEQARLVLPGLLVACLPGATWLTASLVPDGSPARDRAVAAERCGRWSDLVAVAAGPEAGAALDAKGVPLEVEAQVPEAADWSATVARLAGAVGRGRIDKAVLARRLDLVADAEIDSAAALRRLEASAPESTIFAVARGGRTFLGATPERLARSEDREFTTVAMAGSIRRGADAAEDEELAAELLASEKDREEQAVVVERLREVLVPITERLDIPIRPSVVRLRHIQHLATRIGGTLSERAGVLDLVERLHPTPAVGGAPRDLALELIAHEERLERGWYAGPVGWVDRDGDGEFVVAIRSGVVDGRAASLFAGCGIVADSEPAREWEESQIKLRTLAGALGTVRS